MSDELLNCPFCGCSYGMHEQDCYIYMLAVQERFDALDYETPFSEKELEEAWNTRYKRTCHAIIEDECTVCSNCQQDIDPSWVACPYCGAEVVDG